MPPVRLSRPLRIFACLSLALALGTGCPDDPPSTGSGDSSSSSSSGGGTTTTGTPATTTGNDTTAGSGAASGEDSSSSSGAMADSTDSGSTSASEQTGSDSTGPLPDNGCADGEREALLDDVMYPDIAACAGGWSIPGVLGGTAFCDNAGGDDGAIPNGKGCAIDDLCAPDWHLCENAMEVSDRGIADCGALEWDGSFFATRQSGQGMDTCGPMGTNDVFGCGEIGHGMLNGCAPLNVSTGNLCADLSMPWDCDVADDSEAEFLVKEAPELGGALCCRD